MGDRQKGGTRRRGQFAGTDAIHSQDVARLEKKKEIFDDRNRVMMKNNEKYL